MSEPENPSVHPNEVFLSDGVSLIESYRTNDFKTQQLKTTITCYLSEVQESGASLAQDLS